MKKYPSSGHRARLRKRFSQSGLHSFLDYEVIELLLTFGTPRKDCKHVAKQVLRTFGSLKKVLDAPREDLIEIPGIGHENSIGILLFQELFALYQKQRLIKKKALDNAEIAASYLRHEIGKKKQEHVLVLCLNARKQVIASVPISMGILDGVIMHPREVMRAAIAYASAYIILAHNHPSGDASPSSEDIRTTKRIAESSDLMGIPLLDHIIVSDTGYVSLKEEGFL